MYQWQFLVIPAKRRQYILYRLIIRLNTLLDKELRQQVIPLINQLIQLLLIRCGMRASSLETVDLLGGEGLGGRREFLGKVLAPLEEDARVKADLTEEG